MPQGLASGAQFAIGSVELRRLAWGSLICHAAHSLQWLASGAQFAISSGELRQVPRAHKTVCSQQSVLSPCRARGVAHSLSWQCALDGERATGLRPSSSRGSVLQRGRGPGVFGPLPLMATCAREGEGHKGCGPLPLMATCTREGEGLSRRPSPAVRGRSRGF